MNYEVFICPGHHSAEIEADSAAQAKEIFLQQLRDCLDTEHIEAVNLDTDDGEDPAPSNASNASNDPTKGSHPCP